MGSILEAPGHYPRPHSAAKLMTRAFCVRVQYKMLKRVQHDTVKRGTGVIPNVVRDLGVWLMRVQNALETIRRYPETTPAGRRRG